MNRIVKISFIALILFAAAALYMTFYKTVLSRDYTVVGTPSNTE